VPVNIAAILQSVTTLLGFFSLIIIGLFYWGVRIINSDTECLNQGWNLIAIGIALILVIITTTLLAIYKRDVLFYSLPAHILETEARLYGASQKGSSTKKLINKKKGTLPKQSNKSGIEL